MAELKKKIEVMIQADSKSVPGMENDVVDDDSPIDPKDFFSPLKSISNPQKRFSPADDEINRFFETKTCNDFRVVDSSFPYLRRLFIQLNTGLPSSAAVKTGTHPTETTERFKLAEPTLPSTHSTSIGCNYARSKIPPNTKP
ncbi:hypothetical protein OUZ56_009852 [Daphnia magna]|uniref:Uncharacterized protein n=1 Tax=Daphnia magna TaxID=35525 RepID=A0ABR0AHB7_9CRUS|nr:hypothetical protein OUZ56_009852 [Daphnia magna]